ncbi:hypothetical protein H9P43_006799 [Blastocladiella emersonii ATCC 22665]|nr:hypothetical protein H9P43_006799 [Blastocladiella emersonii ATCC 22665]
MPKIYESHAILEGLAILGLTIDEFRILFHHMRDHGPRFRQVETCPRSSTNDPRQFVEWARRAASAPDCQPCPVTLALALLASSSNVPWRVYHLYSVFLRTEMPDERAERIFLDAVNPAHPQYRDWAARWLNIPRMPGTPVSAFYTAYHALLEEAAPGRADDLEGSWPIKLAFAERLFSFVDPNPQHLHPIIWHHSGTVEHMNEVLRGVVFADNELTRGYADVRRGGDGCWFCRHFVDLCPPSARTHPRTACPLIMHPYALSEAIVAAMRVAEIDWPQLQRDARPDKAALARVHSRLAILAPQFPAVKPGKAVLDAVGQMGDQLRGRLLSLVVPTIDELWKKKA